MCMLHLTPAGSAQLLQGGSGAEAIREATSLPTPVEEQFLSSRLLGKFTVETDTLLKVLLHAGVTAGRAGSEDYSGAARRAHCPPKHE